MVFSISFFSNPKPLVVFPCWSASITSTFFPFFANHADKLIAVVVFPTPPFWFVIDMTLTLLIALSPN